MILSKSDDHVEDDKRLQDGQLKLAVLFSSLYEWDETIVYIGSSPGWNLLTCAESLKIYKLNVVCVDPRDMENKMLVRLRRKFHWRITHIKCLFEVSAFRKIVDKLKSMRIQNLIILSDVRSGSAVGVNEHNEDVIILHNALLFADSVNNMYERIRLDLKMNRRR